MTTVADALASAEHVHLARTIARRRGEVERTAEFAKIIGESLGSKPQESRIARLDWLADSVLRDIPSSAGTDWAADARASLSHLPGDIANNTFPEARDAVLLATREALAAFAPQRGIDQSVEFQLEHAVLRAATTAIYTVVDAFGLTLVDELVASCTTMSPGTVRSLVSLDATRLLGVYGQGLPEQIREVVSWRLAIVEALSGIGVESDSELAHQIAYVPEHWVQEVSTAIGDRAISIGRDLLHSVLTLVNEIAQPVRGNIVDLALFGNVVSYRAAANVMRAEMWNLRTDGDAAYAASDAESDAADAREFLAMADHYSALRSGQAATDALDADAASTARLEAAA